MATPQQPSLLALDPLQRVAPWAFWSVAIALIAALACYTFGVCMFNAASWDRPVGELGETSPALDGDLSPAALRAIFFPQPGRGYAPLPSLSRKLEIAVAGDDDATRATVSQNLTFFLHLVNALLIAAVLQQTFSVRLLSATTALLFVSLPVHTEVAVWPMARGESLAMLFSLLALWSFIRFVQLERGRARALSYAGALLFATTAMLSGPNALALPFLLLLYHVCYASGGDTLFAHVRRVSLRLHYHVPLLLLMLFFGFLHTSAAPSAVAGMNFGERMTVMAQIFPRYLSSLVIPTRLAPVYAVPELTGISAPVILSLTALILIPTCALLIFNVNRAMFFAIGWFFLTMLPYANLWPSPALQSDRYLYMPSFAWCLLMAYLVTLLWYAGRAVPMLRAVAVVALASTATFNALGARAYAEQWRDAPSIWRHVLKDSPELVEPRYQLALGYLGEGQDYLARNELEQAMRWMKPGDALQPDVALQLAHVYIRQQNLHAALRLLDPILEAMPDPDGDKALEKFARLYQTRAMVLHGLYILEPAGKDLESAVRFARRIEDYDRRQRTLKPCLFDFGQVSALMNQTNRAEEAYGMCLELDGADAFEPSNLRVGARLASLLSKLERWEDASALISRLLAAAGDGDKSLDERMNLQLALAAVSLSGGRTEDAMAGIRAGLALQPRNFDARLNAAALLQQRGFNDEAETIVREGFIYPEFVTRGSRYLYEYYFNAAKHIWENPVDGRQLAQEMLPRLRKAIDLNTADIRADLLLIQYMTTAVRFAEAETAWNRILPYIDKLPELKSEYAQLYKLWGNRLWLDEKPEEALTRFERYLELAAPGEDTEYVRTLVDTLRRKQVTGTVSEFLAELDAAYRAALAAPDEEQPQRLAETLALIDAQPETTRRDPAVLYLQSLVLASLSKLEESLAALQACIDGIADPTSMPTPWFQAGRVAFLLGRMDDSMKYLTTYTNLTQWRDANARSAGLLLYEIGKFYRQDGDHAAAAAAFDRALGLVDLDKDFAHLYFMLGAEWTAAKRFAAGEGALQNYLRLAGEDAEYIPETKVLLQDIAIETLRCDGILETAREQAGKADYEAAEASIAEALRRMPYRVACHEALGDLNLLRGRVAEARDAYEAATNASVNETDALSAHFKLAKIFAQLGDWGGADRKLKRILRFVPEDASWRQEALNLQLEAEQKLKQK